MDENQDDQVLDRIEKNADIESVLAVLEERKPTDFQLHRVALRYIVTANSREIALLTPERRQAVFDFIDRVHEKAPGAYFQCAACGNSVPTRGATMSPESVDDAMTRHLSGGCWH